MTRLPHDQFAKTPCLIEPFRNGIGGSDIRYCVLKVLMVQAQRERDETALTTLWILTPTCSKKVLQKVGAQPDPEWPVGIYALPLEFRTRIVVIHRLPQEASTLWIRLLGRGRVQKQAIAEVMGLGQMDPERISILKLLNNWRIMLDQKQETLREEERELIMNLSPAYLEWEEKTLNQGKQEGIQLGK